MSNIKEIMSKAGGALVHLLRLIVAPMKNYGAFFVFMYILGAVCTWATIPNYYGAHPYEWALLELVGDVYVLCVVLALLPRRVGLWLKRAIYVLFYALTIIDVFCFVQFETTINPTMLLLIGETNASETAGFFSTYLTPDIFVTNLSWVLLVLVVHIVWTRLRRKIEEAWTAFLHKYHLSGKKMLTFIVAPLLTALLVWCFVETWHNKVALHRLMTFDRIGLVEHELTQKGKGEAYLPLYRLAFSIYANKLTAKQLDVLIDGLDKAKVDSCSVRVPNIVLIIGESYNKHHSQLYGYERPTTPRQLARAKRGELIPFIDAVAPWNLTSFVFKHLFSLYAVGDSGEWCDYPLFPELFKKAGYHVNFFTNQFLKVAKQQVYDFSGGFFLNNPKLSAAMFDTRNERLHVFDEGLLREYDEADPQPSEGGELTIFHLIGQHTDYRIRCPKSRMPFKRDEYKEERPDLKPRELQNLAYYDCGTWYNDSIVDQIIERFEDKDAIVIYLSDHGDAVYGIKGLHFVGRLHSIAITFPMAREEFEIPMWMWCSKDFRKNHPGLFRDIRRASKRRFMSDALAHTLLYLAGIETSHYRPELNVLDAKNYNAERPRVLRHEKDYDELKEDYEKKKAKKEKEKGEAKR